MVLRSVCVFCGSNPGRRPEYRAGAAALGRQLAESGIRVVYGGAHVGTMGALADAVLAAGGEITGRHPGPAGRRPRWPIPGWPTCAWWAPCTSARRPWRRWPMASSRCPAGSARWTSSPRCVTWSQLGLHAKPTGLLNLLGYYDELLRFLDHAVAERFLRPAHREMVLADADPVALLAAMAQWRPEPGAAVKWMDADGADLRPSAARPDPANR